MISRTVLKAQPDGRLAALAAAGSEPAFEAIVHRYRRPLLGYCRRLRMAETRSEDVVQQTFMQAWRSLRDGTEVRELRPWLYRITHNQAVSMMRSIAGDEEELTEFNGGDARGIDPQDVYERQVKLQDTIRAISRLPELQREALLATAIDGLSYQQTADALGVGADGVRGLVYRARTTVRSGIAAVSPTPLIIWAANQGSQGLSSETAQAIMSGVTLGGGSVGFSAAAIKGAVVLASSAAVVGGSVSIGVSKHLLPLVGISNGAQHHTVVAHPIIEAAGPASHASAHLLASFVSHRAAEAAQPPSLQGGHVASAPRSHNSTPATRAKFVSLRQPERAAETGAAISAVSGRSSATSTKDRVTPGSATGTEQAAIRAHAGSRIKAHRSSQTSSSPTARSGMAN